MRAKEFTRETIAPIAPVAPVATRPIDKVIAQTGQPAGPAGINQAIAATPAKPATPYNQSALGTGIGKLGKGLSSLAINPLGKFSRIGSKFGQGFSAGFNNTSDELFKAGTNAAFAADVAALKKAQAPYKQAFDVFAGISKIEDTDPAMINKVDQILKSQLPQLDRWDDHVKRNTTPWDTQRNLKRINPDDIVAYLKQNSRGQKLTATGNPEVDKLLKAQGLI